jgi:hypothetical protein
MGFFVRLSLLALTTFDATTIVTPCRTGHERRKIPTPYYLAAKAVSVAVPLEPKA